MFHVGLHTSQNQAGQRYASAPEMFRGFWMVLDGFGVDQSSESAESHEPATHEARTSLTSSGSMLLVTGHEALSHCRIAL